MTGRVFSALELAAGVAIGGCLLAVVVPAFVNNLHASRLTEAVRGVEDIGIGAVAYARAKAPGEAFPPAAPLTPADVPRGTRASDVPGTWNHLTWAALGFPVDDQLVGRVPGRSDARQAHYFSFQFESANDPSRATFVARAHGDLDGDGERSTFELSGECTAEGARMLPGLYVDREVE